MAPQLDPLFDIPLSDFEGWLPLDKTLGAYLLGTFFGLVLYGVSVHQTYKYYRAFSSDDLHIRLLVVLVMSLETLHAIMTMHSCYYWMVSHYLDIPALLDGVWSLSALPMVMSATMFSSQLFFARRVFLLGPRYRLAVSIAMLGLFGEIGFSIAMTYRAFVVPMIENLSTSAWLVSATLGFGLFADVVFTSALITVIYQSRTDKKRTESLVELAVLYVVNTGLLHGIFNAVSFILSITNAKSLLDAIFNTAAARIYAISLLSVLNSRTLLATKGLAVFEYGSYGLNFIEHTTRRAAAETWNVPHVPTNDPAVININVTTERENWDLQNRNRMSKDVKGGGGVTIL